LEGSERSLAKNCVLRSVIICTFFQIFKGYQIREDDIGEAYSMHGKWCMCINVWLKNCNEMFIDVDNVVHRYEIIEMDFKVNCKDRNEATFIILLMLMGHCSSSDS
jgi:hypothetical protein